MGRIGMAGLRLALALFALGAGAAEALTYSWKPSLVSYNALVATGAPLTFLTPDNGSVVLPLPFAFTYDSVTYASVGVNSNGMLVMGAVTNFSAANGDLFVASAPYNVLAPWWDDMIDDATALVDSSTEGTAPNRVFVIQYRDYPDYASGASMRLNWQVRLYEGSNRVQFIYGSKNGGVSSVFSSASVGIKGQNGTTGFYFEGTMGSRTVPKAALTSATGFPAAGTVFTFAPDTAAPLGLTAAAGSGSANLTWRRTRQTSLLRYRIWVGTSPTSMLPRDSTANLTDTIRPLTGLTNGTTYYVGVTELGPGSAESGFAQVVAVTPNQPPTVSITAPASGSVVTSNAGIITLTANATDPDGSVTQVDYYRGTVLVGTSFAGNPFTVNATAVTGPWSLTARATDNLGATTVSAPVAFTVNLAPTVNLTSPFSSTFALGTTFTLTASAFDGDGTVSKVEFFHEGMKIGEDATDPYTIPWTPDTVGRYALTARATDNSGAITTSATVFVTLERPPTVHFTRPLNGGLLNYPLDTLEATASDSDGTVSEVYFYNGPTYVGAAYGSPYRIPWTLPSRGPFTLIAIAYDNQGLAGKPDTIVVSSYLPPQVSLSAPANFSAFAPGSSIALSAATVAGTRPVSQVRYYRDSILIGTAASGPPFGLNWSNVPAGRYRLQARAVDDHDSVGYSQAVTVFVNDSAKAVPGGRLFITGHDADDHQNYEFISAALDYLLFGKAAGSQDLPIKKGVRIGYLADRAYTWVPVLAYGTPTYINVSQPGWDTVAFSTQHPFDVLITGTGEDYLSSTGSAAVNLQRAKFDAYFNHGGGILAMSEQGLGQSYYNFLPAFGNAQQQSIGSVAGVFTVTPPGLTIGLTESIVDRDETHTEFLNVDTTLFRTFEFYNPDQKPVSIGINAVIGGNIFIPQDSVVAPPEAISRDSVFTDTLCIRFQSPTAGAILHLTTDGGNPDTSSWILANGSQLCIDNSTRFLVIAKKTGWVTSAVKEFRYRRADQVAMPVPDVPAGYFPTQVCVRFTSATPGASILYTLDGGRPDTSSLSKANGDSVCLDASRVIRVLGRKTGMRDSDTSSYAYTHMTKVATPTLDKPDSTWFSSSLCFKFSSTTPGSQIHYTLDGGDPDTVETFVHNGDSLCIDRSLTVRMVAKAANSITSDENRYRYIHMETLARPAAGIPDSTGFSGSLCVRFSTNIDGATLRYSLDGSDPAGSTLTMPMSDSLCLDRTVTIRARAEKTNWNPSPEAAFTYRLMPRVERPTASRADSSWFADTLCVRFATATDSATLRYLLGPGRADTSSLVIPQGQNLCVDRNSVVRVAATRSGWLPSPELPLRFYKMDTAAAPTADPGDSTWFTGRQCIRLSSATAGAAIWYTTDGGDPSASTRALANGDSLCVEDTATVRALARKQDWVDSRAVAFHYIRMPKAATPTADKPDSTYFPEQVCVRLQSASEGVRIRYSLDGGRADTSGLSIANGDTLCVDRSVRIKAVAVGGKWSPSDELGLYVIRMGTLPSPEAGVPDSTWFRDSLCVPWTTSTAGAAITVRPTFLAADGKPAGSDSTSKTLASGDSVCLDRSATLRAVAGLKNWKDSPEAVRSYFRMDTAAKPVFGLRDTVFYPSICVEVSTSTPGADIRYTLDGGKPDTSRLVKHSSDTICIDRSTQIRAVAERKNSIPSQEAVLRLEKMPQVAPLVSSVGDSAVFAHRLCFTLSSATDSVRIRYTLGGGDPLDDTLSVAGGGTVCVEHSSEIVAVGTRPLWRNSPEIHISVAVDNDGPRVTKAEKHPFDIQNLSVTGNCRGIGQDTLKVAFSERLFPKSNPPRWDRMLRFSPSCESGDGLPVKPSGDPVISADGLEATILLDNASSDEKPKLGNCLSLDWLSGEFPDRVGNPPERHGVRIEGSENKGSISEIRAYPPVVGLDNAQAAGNGCRDEGVHDNTWIPPVGFDPVRGTVDPDRVRSCPSGGEATGRSSIPACMSIVEVVSDGPYVADVRIFDQLGNFVHGSRQQFGACGELDNLERSVDGKKRSYLLWNTRDRAGARAGNGVYVWRIAFQAEKNGIQGVHTVMIRTGFLRTGACSD